MENNGIAKEEGNDGRGRRPTAFSWQTHLSLGLLFAAGAAAALGWISYHPAKPQLDIFWIAAILLLFLVFFHSIAWSLRQVTTLAAVWAIDYFYLATAVAGLAMSHLRQDSTGSVYLVSWSRPVVLLLLAALAIRLTRTTIEAFGWYRR
jgi:hypothetical protein